MAQDPSTGKVLAGVGDKPPLSKNCNPQFLLKYAPRLSPGIYFLHECDYGIYVANLVPNSAASHCGLIKNGDFLVQVDAAQLAAVDRRDLSTIQATL